MFRPGGDEEAPGKQQQSREPPKTISKSALSHMLYHLHRRCSVYARMLTLTHDTMQIAYASLKLGSVSYARQMSAQCLELAHKSETLHDNCQNLLNLHLSLVGFRTNELMGVLTVFSAFFIPVTFIAGVYGMNFVNIPELGYENGYFFCLLGMALVEILIAIMFRMKGIL